MYFDRTLRVFRSDDDDRRILFCEVDANVQCGGNTATRWESVLVEGDTMPTDILICDFCQAQLEAGVVLTMEGRDIELWRN